MNQNYLFILLAAALLISLPESEGKRRKKKNKKVDGVTTASTRAAPQKPGPDDKYKLLGTFTGIKSTIIQYDNKLYIGGMLYSENGYKTLKDIGIRTIISFLPTSEERSLAKKHGFKLVEIDINQSTGITKEQIKTFEKAIEKSPAPFYLHCFNGFPLSAAFGARYRMKYCKWNKKRALKEFVKLGGHLVLDQSALKNALQ